MAETIQCIEEKMIFSINHQLNIREINLTPNSYYTYKSTADNIRSMCDN